MPAKSCPCPNPRCLSDTRTSASGKQVIKGNPKQQSKQWILLETFLPARTSFDRIAMTIASQDIDADIRLDEDGGVVVAFLVVDYASGDSGDGHCGGSKEAEDAHFYTSETVMMN